MHSVRPHVAQMKESVVTDDSGLQNFQNRPCCMAELAQANTLTGVSLGAGAYLFGFHLLSL